MTKINKKKPQSLKNTFTEFLLYKTPNKQVKVEIFCVMKIFGSLKKKLLPYLVLIAVLLPSI